MCTKIDLHDDYSTQQTQWNCDDVKMNVILSLCLLVTTMHFTPKM